MKYEILVEDIIDSLDASVFNGDLFFNQENREDLRNWMSRWEKQLKEYDEPEYEDGPEFEGWEKRLEPQESVIIDITSPNPSKNPKNVIDNTVLLMVEVFHLAP